MTSFFEKALGLMAGSAIGDSLGAPVEGMSREDIRKVFFVMDRFFEIQEAFWYRDRPELVARYWRMGRLHTDDTQMLLAIVECFLETGGLEERDLAGHFFRLFPVCRGSGRGFRQFYLGMKKGCWPPAASDSPGAGAAMRAAGVALTMRDAPDDEETLLRRIILQGALTTSSAHALFAAVVVGVAAHNLLFAEDKDPARQLGTRLIERVAKELAPAERIMRACVADRLEKENITCGRRDISNALQLLQKAFTEIASYPRTMDVYQSIVDRIGDAARPLSPNATGTKNHALEAPMTALFTAAFWGHDYQQAVLAAVNMGSDTDTTAAMTGQLVGAFVGFDPEKPAGKGISESRLPPDGVLRGIPVKWFLDQKGRVLLWHSAAKLSAQPSELPNILSDATVEERQAVKDFYGWEKEWTLRERARRKEIKKLLGQYRTS